MRKKECLSGEWLFLPDYEGVDRGQDKIMVPSTWRWVINEKAQFQPYDMFDYPREWNKAQAGIISRKILIDSEDDHRVFAIFEGVFQKYMVFINDIKVLETEESFLTTEIDITDYVINGEENEIKVWCGPYDTIDTETGLKRLSPDGTWYANMARGIWQNVYLEYRPNKYIDDVTVSTSTRNKTIDIKANIINEYNQTMNVIAKVYKDEKVIKEWKLSNNSVHLGNIEFATKELWDDAIYWSPENPHLYVLQVELTCDGRIIDTYEVPFGFREIWADGHKLYLNGKRINLRGDAWHYQGFVQQTKEYVRNWYKACRETGINFVRLHGMPYPKIYLDIADEEGMLIIDESAIYGSAKRIQADHPQFISNCKNHLTKLVKRDKNHPSVIIWSMQNEMRWVDGRNGYKQAMKDLSATIKALDCTRPIAYDGDNRLVDPEDMEIVSMHYNIDGTISDWDKEKPLIFGEHGKWHYVSPQVSTAMKGSDVYLSFEKSIESIGLEEKHFIEYARREEVTGVSPFNMINYTMHMQPQQDINIPESMNIEEVRPKVIKAHTTPITNGFFEQEQLFYPNSSWKHLKDAFKPVAIIPNEYNHSFYDNRSVKKSFNIYNDCENNVEAKVDYKLITKDGDILLDNEYIFNQSAGEKQEWELILDLPAVSDKTTLILQMELYHNDRWMNHLEEKYKVYPSISKKDLADTSCKKVGYLGKEEGYEVIVKLVEKVEIINECLKENIDKLDLLIIGNNCTENVKKLQPVLQDFVNDGGYLLILEQESFVPGEITLSGKKFFSAFINDEEHPVFDGIEQEDLLFWGSENVNNSNYTPVVTNGFNKPVQGDLNILLECGEGDFGWGGLLWSPLVEYSVGKGRVMLSQLNIIKQFEETPQAGLMLSNMIRYGIDFADKRRFIEDNDKPLTGLLASNDSKSGKFLADVGVEYEVVSAMERIEDYSQLIVDLKGLKEKEINLLTEYAKQGGKLLILPVGIDEKNNLQDILGNDVEIEARPVYQLKPVSNKLTKGISNYDLYHYEKVTYSPSDKSNLIISDYSIYSEGGIPLFESINNPWHEFFVNGFDEEFMKISIADIVEETDFVTDTYGIIQDIGKGQAVVIQLNMIDNNDKIKRVYSRLLSNLGIEIDTSILTYEKEEKDYGIQSVMALPQENHQDYNEMVKYFSDKDYLLNNLGEGVYGWMKRIEKKDGFISISGSTGKTYFITLFIESNINRNPEKRGNGELPDSSIVPDLYVDVNCSFELFVNSKSYDNLIVEEDTNSIKIDDVVLDKGINRMCMICKSEDNDIKFNICFKNKYGDYMNGLRYLLTLD